MISHNPVSLQPSPYHSSIELKVQLRPTQWSWTWQRPAEDDKEYILVWWKLSLVWQQGAEPNKQSVRRPKMATALLRFGYTILKMLLAALRAGRGRCVMNACFTYRVRSCKSPEFFVSHLFQSWLHSDPAYLENCQQKQSIFLNFFLPWWAMLLLWQSTTRTQGKASSLHSLNMTTNND